MPKDSNDKFLALCDRFGEEDIRNIFKKYNLNDDNAITANSNTKNFIGTIHSIEDIDNFCFFATKRKVDLNEKMLPPLFNSLLSGFKSDDSNNDKDEIDDFTSLKQYFQDRLDEIEENINSVDEKVTGIYKSEIENDREDEMHTQIANIEKMISHAANTKTVKKAEFEQAENILAKLNDIELSFSSSVSSQGRNYDEVFLDINKSRVTMKPFLFYGMLLLIIILTILLLLKGGI